MDYFTLEKSQLKLSKVVAGGWQAGKSDWVGIDDKESISAFQAAYEAGINTFDTAADYGEGHGERVLGQAIKSFRQQIYLSSKVWPNEITQDKLSLACERSLKNLQTDYLDIYFVHWPSGSWGTKPVALAETMEALQSLKKAGKIRAIGVSNFSPRQLQEALDLGPVEIVQECYSLLYRNYENTLKEIVQQYQLGMMAYSPLAQGLLAGKSPDTALAAGDNRQDNYLYSSEFRALVKKTLARLRELADQEGVSLNQLALGYIGVQEEQMAVVGARNAAQATQNAQAGTLRPSEALLGQVEEASQALFGKTRNLRCLWNWSVEA